MHCLAVTIFVLIFLHDGECVVRLIDGSTTPEIVDSSSSFICPKNWHRVDDSKCVHLPTPSTSERRLFHFDAARDYCLRQHPHATLISLTDERLNPQIRRLLTKHYYIREATYLFLTSGIREGSAWIWSEERVLLQKSLFEAESMKINTGRCSAILWTFSRARIRLVSVDCVASAYIPICELNLAANCTPSHGFYAGRIARTKSGADCLFWNDPALLAVGIFAAEQRRWRHNACRNPNGLAGLTPWCMINATTFEECDVPRCERLVADSPMNVFAECAAGDTERRCGTSAQCVRREFWCDYEKDCRNGYDELNCEDNLLRFELVGEYKLVEQVSEIWTNIPTVQGCAKRCVENVDFRCESFSYEQSKQLCMLSKLSQNPAILVERLDSHYYQRTFGKRVEKVSLDSFVVLVKAKLADFTQLKVTAPVCLDSNSDVDLLCEQFGFGLPLNSMKLCANESLASSSSSRIEWTKSWTIECLRSDVCAKPTMNCCERVLRCSNCDKLHEFACKRDAKCVKKHQVCDGRADCEDGSDESADCFDIKFRFHDDYGDSLLKEGRVQLRFHDVWSDVCADGLDQPQIDRICRQLTNNRWFTRPHPHHHRIIFSGESRGRILPIFEQTPTRISWHLNCLNNNSKCAIAKMEKCGRAGILNLRCEAPQTDSCGRIDVQKSSAFGRVRRVVGGTKTQAGSSPWTAALWNADKAIHHCGATIIATRFLLSAAHCFQELKEPTDFYAIVGDWDNSLTEEFEQLHNLSKIHFFPMHENDAAQLHDIALVELSTPLNYSAFVRPICLPPRGYRYREGQLCTVTGWGSNGRINDADAVEASLVYPRQMHSANIPILNRDACRNASRVYAALGPNSFCGGYPDGGVDSCQGDSGGPFACEHNEHYYLSGVISWGDGCAERRRPGIYTMITPYLSWIESVTGLQF